MSLLLTGKTCTTVSLSVAAMSGRSFHTNPFLEREFTRLRTFERWTFHDRLQAWPTVLAAAGFYYEGNGDETRCFQCGCVVRNWQDRGDPLEEHRRVNPHCPYLTEVRMGSEANDTSLPTQLVR